VEQLRLAIVFMFLNSANSIFEGHVYTLKNQSYSYIFITNSWSFRE